MRFVPCCLLSLLPLWSACDAEPAPPTAAAPTPARVPLEPAGAPVAADPGMPSLAARLLAGNGSPADQERAAAHPAETVLALLAAAAGGDDVQRGRAPALIAGLGPAAVPGLAQALGQEDPIQRRMAAMATLLLGPVLHERGAAGPILAPLREAATDADPAVRAVAEHALRRATGDTSALDQSRAAHAEAERAGR